MDQTCILTHKGEDYTFTVVASTEAYPHFYWCLLSDPELIEVFGEDCVAFKVKADGVLHPAYFYTGEAQALLDQLRAVLIAQYFQPQHKGK